MKRVHLFEIEDQAWFPAVVRDYMTDFLTFMARFSEKPLSGFANRLAEAMAVTKDTRIIELGSGGGGPSVVLSRLLRRTAIPNLSLVMTDLYPNLPRLRESQKESDADVTIVETSVDATNVPRELQGFRLMCNIFHHLSPDMARRCLADAVAKRQGIAVMELVERSFAGFAQLAVAMVVMMLATPFVRPFRLSRLLLTYVLPIVPVCTLWDGIVSCLRIYSPDELRELIGQLPDGEYAWDVGRMPIPNTPVAITYLIGTPR